MAITCPRHERRGLAGEAPACGEVRIDDVAPILFALFDQRLAHDRSGVAQQDVEPTVACGDLIDGGYHRIGVTYVKGRDIS